MRALARNSRLIVMDEPTARLSAEESQKLLDIVRQLQAGGVTIVYVSHFLREVLAVADTITVLRNGEVVQTTPAATQTADSLVTAMLGRAASLTFPERIRCDPAAPTVLSVRDLRDAARSTMCRSPSGPGRSSGSRDWSEAAALRWRGRSSAPIRLDSGTIELNGATVDIRSRRHRARDRDAAREQERPGTPHAAAGGAQRDAAPSVGRQSRRRRHRRRQGARRGR